jgi:hypothetical protein
VNPGKQGDGISRLCTPRFYDDAHRPCLLKLI